MNIIILGTNQISISLIENLVHEENDVTVIDNNVEVLYELQNKLDIRTIVGHGSYPGVLSVANAGNADMLLAVSDSDEVNMLACQIAYTLFNVPIKIARVRSPYYLTDMSLFSNEGMPVDVCISPEGLVTDQIAGLIEYPGALQVLDFFDGRLHLISMKPYFGGQMVGKSLQTLKETLEGLHINIAAIYRNDEFVPLTPETKIKIGDEIFFVGKPSDVKAMMKLLRHVDHAYKSITIAGGGNIGGQLAQRIENNFHVKVIERNHKVAQSLAERLLKGIVLNANCADKDLLISESIENTDVFCALTNDDESNILSCLQAKRLGVKEVMALVTNSAYIELMERSEIDIFVSPQLSTISQILTYIRRGDVQRVYALRRGKSEVIEVIAHGDESTSKVVDRSIEALGLPEEIRIVAILRGDEILLPHHQVVIKNEDRILAFVSDKKFVRTLENLFQVKVTFF